MTSPPSIALGVSGSIAAYKAIYLLRLLVEDDWTVTPVLTRSAQRFVGELSFSALCGRRAITDLWSQASAGEIGHVETAHAIDLLLIAPCTADLLARLAAGRADDPLTAIALATRAPMLIAPAMETGMWENTATQQNLASLRARGVTVVEPASGALASGRLGTGRMAEPESIQAAARGLLAPQDLAGKRVLLTAGPTREAYDPVRFMSNASSGKMGYALASVAQRRGARVELVSGPTALPAPHGVALIPVQTTEQMLEACEPRIEAADIFIMAAAPADFRPVRFSKQKLKKADQPNGLTAGLESTPDILQTLRAHQRGCFVVGFAAESINVASHARDKLQSKGLDMIVANDITRPDAGFGVDTNAVTIIARGGYTEELPLMTKERVAEEIWDRVAEATK